MDRCHEGEADAGEDGEPRPGNQDGQQRGDQPGDDLLFLEGPDQQEPDGKQDGEGEQVLRQRRAVPQGAGIGGSGFHSATSLEQLKKTPGGARGDNAGKDEPPASATLYRGGCGPH
jgi:hypothetical protein